MIAFIFAVFLLVAPVVGQEILYTEQFPKLATAGQAVRVRFATRGISQISFQADGSSASTPATGLGNGLFEVSIVAPPIQPRHLFQRYVGQARATTTSGGTAGANVSLRYLDGLPPVRLTSLAADARRSDYVLNIQMQSFYDKAIVNAEFRGFFYEDVLRRMYQLVGDDYDFVNVIVGNWDITENRYHAVVRTDYSGTGQQPISAAVSMGSAARLLGVTMFPIPGYFDGADHSFQHELGHQWVNWSTKAPYLDPGKHWPISSMATGLMGWSDPLSGQGFNFSCRFLPQADGTMQFGPGGVLKTFNDFDLYLMGLMDAKDVEAQYRITAPAKIALANQGCAALGTLAVGQYEKVTIEQLIALNGPRVPGVASSRKDFRVMNVVVSRDGLLSSEEMAYLDVMARRSEERGMVPFNIGREMSFSNPWYVSTKQRSTLRSQLSTEAMPTISYGGVVNAANFSREALGGGVVATIFGTDLAKTTASAAAVPLPEALGGVRVIVNGKAAPLFYVSPTQINFQLPAGLPTTPTNPSTDEDYLAAVRVERDGLASNLAFVEVKPIVLGLMSYGNGYAVATRPDGAVIGPNTPAAPGQTITLYWVGTVPLTETVEAGRPAPAERLVRVASGTNVSASMGGLFAPVQFAGLTPGGVGLYQLNVTVPNNHPTGESNLILSVGGAQSNAVKVVVRR